MCAYVSDERDTFVVKVVADVSGHFGKICCLKINGRRVIYDLFMKPLYLLNILQN
jgi:hypothetical protein